MNRTQEILKEIESLEATKHRLNLFDKMGNFFMVGVFVFLALTLAVDLVFLIPQVFCLGGQLYCLLKIMRIKV